MSDDGRGGEGFQKRSSDLLEKVYPIKPNDQNISKKRC
jgi:hypothetical protein